LSNGNARWRNAAGQVVPRVVAIGALLLVWWATVASGLLTEAELPLPGDVLSAFVNSFATPDPPRESILQATQASLIRLVVGMSVGIVVGTLMGLAMASSELIQRSLGSLMAGLQALPSISWLPLAIVWFGLSERAILFVVIIATIPAWRSRRPRASGSCHRSSCARAEPSVPVAGCSSVAWCFPPRSRRTSPGCSRRGPSRGGR
jgi:ABC-type nitrate/sulfonate/bicarbonate transport system permease component